MQKPSVGTEIVADRRMAARLGQVGRGAAELVRYTFNLNFLHKVACRFELTILSRPVQGREAVLIHKIGRAHV